MLISISHVDGVSCESQICRVSEELSIAVPKNSKTSPPGSVQTHFSKEWTEYPGKNQQTDLFVWVVKHRNECRDAFQAPHVGLDLENKDKGTAVHKPNPEYRTEHHFCQPPGSLHGKTTSLARPLLLFSLTRGQTSVMSPRLTNRWTSLIELDLNYHGSSFHALEMIRNMKLFKFYSYLFYYPPHAASIFRL